MSLQLVANVVVLAAIYALVSTGYVLIYRVSRVLNLAHVLDYGRTLGVGSAADVLNNPAVIAAYVGTSSMR